MERLEPSPIEPALHLWGLDPAPALPPRAVVAAAEIECRARLRAALVPIGWELSEVHDAWELLDHLGAGLRGRALGLGPDLLLFDVRLPGPDWARILDAVQSTRPGLPVVLVCATDGGSATGAGVVGVLREPLRSDRIVTAAYAALRVG